MPNNSREYQTPYQREYRQKKREWARAQFGSKCLRCGSAEKLEFDHIDPSTKIDDVANIIVYGTWEELKAEIIKCQLLCRACHRQKSIENGEVLVASHGTPGMYDYRCGNCQCVPCLEGKRKSHRDLMRKWRANRKVA